MNPGRMRKALVTGQKAIAGNSRHQVEAMDPDWTALDTLFSGSRMGVILFKGHTPVYFNDTAGQWFGQKGNPALAMAAFARKGAASSTCVNGRHLRIEQKSVLWQGQTLKAWILSDLTRQKELEDRVLLLETMMNSVEETLYAVDARGREIYRNKRVETFEPSQRKQMVAELMSVFDSRKPIKEKYRQYLTHDHREIHVISSFVPVKKGNDVVAAFLVNRFITRIRHLLLKAMAFQSRLLKRSEDRLANGTQYQFQDIIGQSPQMRQAVEKARRAALSRAAVLLFGETGTGKEMVAQSIHNGSPSAKKPFVAINCAAIPETLLESMLFGTVKGVFTGAEDHTGLMEQAEDGTLFLDEINSMGPNLQAKLLRVIEEKKVRRLGDSRETAVHCRIISSTNADPWELMAKGLLREDFFYRIAAVVLSIPPLREREQDVLLLARHFLDRFNTTYGSHVTRMAAELEGRLLSHTWPGNVRELSHVLEGAFNLLESPDQTCLTRLPEYFQYRPDAPDAPAFPSVMPQGVTLPEMLKTLEKRLLLKALEKNRGNITRSAEQLGIHRQSLQARMKKLKIQKTYRAT